MEVKNSGIEIKRMEHPLVTRSKLLQDIAFSPPMVIRDKDQPFQGCIFPTKPKQSIPEVFTFSSN